MVPQCNYPKVDHPNTLIIYKIGSHHDSIISIIESIACKSSADYNVVKCSTINSPVRDDVKRLNDNCICKEVKQFYHNNRNNFKIAHIGSVNSVRPKFEPFREVLLENICDVLSIQ